MPWKDPDKHRQYRKRVAAHTNERMRKYYQDNKERINAKNRAWAIANAERLREYQREYRKNNKLHLRELGRQERYATKRLVLQHYGGHCDCCGESMIEFLAIDHINGGGNRQRLAGIHHTGLKMYRWLRKQGYPEGFRVLCHNCNQALGAYGYCPHQTGSKA